VFIQNKKLLINSILVFVFISLAATLIYVTAKVNETSSIDKIVDKVFSANSSKDKPWDGYNPKTGDPSVDESKLETKEE
jgi:hypothetical protein